MMSTTMKVAAITIIILAFLAGGVTGYGYSWWRSERYYANDRIDRLHRQSAEDVKTYTRLLRLIRSGDTERAFIYLEALLDTAQLTLSAVLNEFPDFIQSSTGRDALKDMEQYRNEYPKE